MLLTKEEVESIVSEWLRAYEYDEAGRRRTSIKLKMPIAIDLSQVISCKHTRSGVQVKISSQPSKG